MRQEDEAFMDQLQPQQV